MKTKIVCITCADKHLIPLHNSLPKPHWTGSCRCEQCRELKRTEFLRYAAEKFTVHLTYFKPNGKFYAVGEFEVSAGKPIHEIFDLVAEKAVAQKLPGFNEGHGEFIVHVNIPSHPHNFPALINTEAVLMQKERAFRQGW